MNNEKSKAIIESILFCLGESVEISRLAAVLELDIPVIRRIIDELKDDYAKENRGVTLIELENRVQLCTKPELYEYLIRIAKTPGNHTLSEAALETLAIIAYKQPITRLEIENIRGVNATYIVNRLMEFDLIREAGRLDAPGRPMLFSTSEQFLRSFGIKSLKELPQADNDKLSEFRLQAAREAGTELEDPEEVDV